MHMWCHAQYEIMSPKICFVGMFISWQYNHTLFHLCVHSDVKKKCRPCLILDGTYLSIKIDFLKHIYKAIGHFHKTPYFVIPQVYNISYVDKGAVIMTYKLWYNKSIIKTVVLGPGVILFMPCSSVKLHFQKEIWLKCFFLTPSLQIVLIRNLTSWTKNSKG